MKKFTIKRKRQGDQHWNAYFHNYIYANSWMEAKKKFRDMVCGWFACKDNYEIDEEGRVIDTTTFNLDGSPHIILDLDPIDTFDHDSVCYTIKRVD